MQKQGIQLPKGIDFLGWIVYSEPHDPQRDAVCLVAIWEQSKADLRASRSQPTRRLPSTEEPSSNDTVTESWSEENDSNVFPHCTRDVSKDGPLVVS